MSRATLVAASAYPRLIRYWQNARNFIRAGLSSTFIHLHLISSKHCNERPSFSANIYRRPMHKSAHSLRLGNRFNSKRRCSPISMFSGCSPSSPVSWRCLRCFCEKQRAHRTRKLQHIDARIKFRLQGFRNITRNRPREPRHVQRVLWMCHWRLPALSTARTQNARSQASGEHFVQRGKL